MKMLSDVNEEGREEMKMWELEEREEGREERKKGSQERTVERGEGGAGEGGR